MTRTLSKKFRFFTFVCIALLPYVHGYNLHNTYLTPYSTVEEPLTFTGFFEYLVANGLLRFRIPMLFLISGYLYAMYDNRPYRERITKRFKTLMVPFFIWSAAGLMLTFLLQQIPYTAEVVRNAQLDQLGDNRPYTEIGIRGILYRWVSAPISFQLWFIVSLFIYNLSYPVLRWLIEKLPYIWLGITFILWFTLFEFIYIEGKGLFFFSLGIFLQKSGTSIEKAPRWFSLGLTFIFFLGICIIKTFMAFEFETDVFLNHFIIHTLYQLASLTGVLVVWFGGDRVVNWFMGKKWFHSASAFSFFIFGMHIPLLAYMMRFGLMELDFIPYHRLLCYLLIPALVILICIGTGALFRKYFPKMYLVMTGGRGI